MPNFSDYIFRSTASIGLSGVYVRLVNNSSGTPYVAGPTDVNGLFTFTAVPAGLYTIYTGPTASGAWTATGDTNYVVNPAAPVANTDLAGPLLNAVTAGSNMSVGAAPGAVGGQSVALVSNPTLSGLLTAQAGLTLTSLLTLLDAASRIVPGATSLSLRNNANNADNLLLTDAGLATLRNALTIAAGGLTVTAGGIVITAGGLSIPPSAGASLPSTAYGTVPVKLDDQSGASAATIVLTVPAGALYRALMIEFEGRSDNASGQSLALRFNADSGANYDVAYIANLNTTVTGNNTPGGTSGRCGSLTASGAPAGSVAGSTIRIQNADSATLQKPWEWTNGRFDTDAAANAAFESGYGKWRNTANAVTSITLSPGTGNIVNFRAVLWGLP